MLFIARSTIYYPGHTRDSSELSDEIIIPSYHLNILIQTFQENEPLLAKLTNVDKELSYVVAIGNSHNYDKNTIYVPQWILDIIQHDGVSDGVISIRKLTTTELDEMPPVTNITIKPLDYRLFELDIISCCETAMMNLHSIKQDTTLCITLPDASTSFVYIEKVEPSTVSRIVNGEVNVEVINEFADLADLDAGCPDSPVNLPIYRPELDKALTEVTNSNTVVEQEPEQEKQPELSAEERRRLVRESWLKKFMKNSEAPQ